MHVLFDLDGVMVDSSASVARQWERWADEHGVDMALVRPLMFGRPSEEVVRAVAPQLDAAKESETIDGRQAEDPTGVTAMPGAKELVSSLPSWTVVTSARRVLAEARLGFAGLPVPETMVTAEHVSRGKPDPEPYLLGAERLGASPGECVVVEDAPAGIEAGRAAGMRTVAITSTHPAAELSAADLVSATLSELGL